ncbi:unnamed protein product, partial [Aureobasidium pullulans]
MEDHTHEITEVPEAARVVTMALSMITISVLAICLSKFFSGISRTSKSNPSIARRIQFVKNWKGISVTNGPVLSKAYSLNQSRGICDGAIVLCLLCYMTTKIDEEQAMAFQLLWCDLRIAYINEKGVCVIGMKRKALVPLITFDVLLNVYLTSLFLHPLRQCYSFKTGTNSRMRTLVFRTFVGSCATLVMSVVNLSILTILDGEPGYICLCLCNLDIIVLHWATAVDRQDQTTNTGSRKPKNTLDSSRGGLTSATGGKQGDYVELDERAVSKLTTKIEANRTSPGDDRMNSHAIEVKTQHVQEVEIEPYDIDCESGNNWRESQERIVKPGSI